MRKQALFLAACAAIVIGCGGGGHHSTKSTTTSTGTTGGMAVTLPNPTVASFDVTYLTGEGRAIGDLYLAISRQTIGTTADNVGLSGASTYYLGLTDNDDSTLQLPRINVPFTLTSSGYGDSRLFSTLTFDPDRLVVKTTGSNGGVTYEQGPTLNGLPFIADARIRAFPGRTSTIQINVAPSEFPVDGNNSTSRTFDSTQFKGLNYSTDTTDSDGYNKLSSRLSDFVRFPLSGLPSTVVRPALRTGYGAGDIDSNPAAYVYFSGDNIALSSGDAGATNGTRIFQEVASQFSDDPNDPVGNTLIGLWSNATSGGFTGTYDLRDILPGSIEVDTPINRLISLNGGFYDFANVLSGGSTFDIILFPNSAESYGASASGSGRDADIVAIVHSGTTITNIYFGGADLSATSPSQGTFRLFPIQYLGTNPATFDGEIDGTLSGYRNSSGVATTNYASVRRIGFAFNADADLPAGFTNSGTITVFRP